MPYLRDGGAKMFRTERDAAEVVMEMARKNLFLNPGRPDRLSWVVDIY